MFFTDETDRPRPEGGTLEEKATYDLQVIRAEFYFERDTYDECKDGTPYPISQRLVYGNLTADARTAQCEARFNTYLRSALLTADGETTDPKYPIDQMVNREKRRRRAMVILTVYQHTFRLGKMLDGISPAHWTPQILMHNMYSFFNDYSKRTYREISGFMQGPPIKTPSIADLYLYMSVTFDEFASSTLNTEMNAEYHIARIRDGLCNYLLVDLPYGLDKLTAPAKLIADESLYTEPKPATVH